MLAIRHKLTERRYGKTVRIVNPALSLGRDLNRVPSIPRRAPNERDRMEAARRLYFYRLRVDLNAMNCSTPSCMEAHEGWTVEIASRSVQN